MGEEFLPGMKPKRIAALIDAANAYLDFKDRIASIKKRLEGAEVAVAVEMRKCNLSDYAFGGLTIHVEEREKIKVARRAEAPVEVERGERRRGKAKVEVESPNGEPASSVE